MSFRLLGCQERQTAASRMHVKQLVSKEGGPVRRSFLRNTSVMEEVNEKPQPTCNIILIEKNVYVMLSSPGIR